MLKQNFSLSRHIFQTFTTSSSQLDWPIWKKLRSTRHVNFYCYETLRLRSGNTLISIVLGFILFEWRLNRKFLVV